MFSLLLKDLICDFYLQWLTVWGRSLPFYDVAWGLTSKKDLSTKSLTCGFLVSWIISDSMSEKSAMFRLNNPYTLMLCSTSFRLYWISSVPVNVCIPIITFNYLNMRKQWSNVCFKSIFAISFNPKQKYYYFWFPTADYSNISSASTSQIYVCFFANIIFFSLSIFDYFKIKHQMLWKIIYW